MQLLPKLQQDSNRLSLTILSGLVALGMGSAGASAAPFLSVDFGPSRSTTQTGFLLFDQHNVSGRTYSTSEGDIFVNVLGEQPAGEDGYFDRAPIADNGPFTFGDLYRDFAFNNNEKLMDFTLTGLSVNTAYSVTWFSYDDGGSHSVSFAGISGSSGSVGPLNYTGGVVPITNYDPNNAGTALFTTDGSGGLTVRATDTGDLRVNGFQIEVIPVPEPSSAALILLGMVTAAVRRRRA